jgi:hypothetical protein
MTINRPKLRLVGGVEFRPPSERVVPSVRVRPSEPLEDFPETRRQRASRQRNPIRKHLGRIEYAVIIAGRLHRNEPMDPLIDPIAVLQKGREAATSLAMALAQLIAHECGQ